MNFDSNNVDNKIKFDYSRLSVKKILKEYDTINGVHIHFENDAKYEMLVAVLSMLEQEGASHYIVEHRDIWIMNITRPEPENRRYTGMTGSCIVYTCLPEVIREEESQILLWIKNNKPSTALALLTFIILCFLSWRNIRRVYCS
ncbi:hypothetical protein DQQ10_26450 [Pseudochryseolinea flava]|uniref:Uncharacterized protein n=2 Tax=Pseudochryseolinea flava TaxID=2059302 RepID=A0A364XVB7_9BACT|nr:hypothetical protein DQQ10_26450 [Pseudochryseolinea flava]